MNRLITSPMQAISSTTTMDRFDANTTSNLTFGNTTSEPELDLFPTPGYVGRFLQTATMTFIFVAAVIGNTLVILLCLKKPKELKVSRRLILHLAILNFSMTVLVLPSVIVSAAAQDWVMSQGWCMASSFFKNLLLVCIILNLVLISVDRYFSVVKPLHYYSSATVKYHGALLVTIWVTSALFALPPLIGWNNTAYHPNRYMCTSDWTQGRFSHTIFIFVLGFIVPFLIMMYVYFTIYNAARRLMKRKQGRRLSADVTDSYSGSGMSGGGSIRSSTEHSTTSHTGSTRKKMFRRRSSKHRINVSEEWKIAKTGVIVMASFVICWLPYYIVLMVDQAYGFGTTVPLSMPYAWWECFATWMALSSCAINPYVYVLRSPPMRRQASKTARNTIDRMRECFVEDSRMLRRRQSEKTGRYSFRSLSNRFSSYRRPGNGVASSKKPKQQRDKEQQKEPEQQTHSTSNPSDPEAQKMMTPDETPSPPPQIDERTHDKAHEESDTEAEAQVELLSHKTIDV